LKDEGSVALWLETFLAAWVNRLIFDAFFDCPFWYFDDCPAARESEANNLHPGSLLGKDLNYISNIIAQGMGIYAFP
jgi:hypothetical protein